MASLLRELSAWDMTCRDGLKNAAIVLANERLDSRSCIIVNDEPLPSSLNIEPSVRPFYVVPSCPRFRDPQRRMKSNKPLDPCLLIESPRPPARPYTPSPAQ